MIKKTRKLKGGKTTLEKFFGTLNGEGPFVADNIYDKVVNKHQGTNLKEEYKLRKELAEQAYKIAEHKYDEKEKINQMEEERTFKYKKFHEDSFYKKIVLIITVFSNLISGFFKYLIQLAKLVVPTIQKALNSIGSGAQNLFNSIMKIINAGRGAIVRFILLLLFIAILLSMTINIFGGKGSPTLNTMNNKTSFDVLVNMRPKDFLSDINNTFSNMIPDKYKIQLNVFKNNINKFIGNDIIANSIDNKPRETINNGRFNGISNIKLKDNNDNIFNLYKPVEKQLNIDMDLYKDTDIDFYKLPANLRTKIMDQTTGKVKDKNTLSYEFKVKEKLMEDGRIKYRYVINENEDSKIPITTDLNLNNNFSIIKKPIIPINITDKDINKYKDNLMFKYKNGNFVYPYPTDKIINYNR